MRVMPLGLREGDRQRLSAWTRSSTVRSGLAKRARIVLLAADGVSHTDIAELVGVSRPTVTGWRRRYERSGIAGLSDERRPGRPRSIDHAKIVAETLKPPPKKLGVTHWGTVALSHRVRPAQQIFLPAACAEPQPAPSGHRSGHKGDACGRLSAAGPQDSRQDIHGIAQCNSALLTPTPLHRRNSTLIVP